MKSLRILGAVLSVQCTALAVAACAGVAPNLSPANTAAARSSSAGRQFRTAGNGYAVVYSFANQPSHNDAAEPDGPLAQDAQGNFFGTSLYSGLYYGHSTVFELMPGNPFTDSIVYKFNAAAQVGGGVVIDSGGGLFGVSTVGPSYGCSFVVYGCGFIFKLKNSASGWTETTLHVFKGNSDGAFPSGGLLLVNGTLYGVTKGGGGLSCAGSNDGCGTVYKISTFGGGYTVLHTFGGDAKGNTPSGVLTNINGILFGTAEFGGPAQCYNNNGCGVVYSLKSDGSGYSVVHYFEGAANSDGAAPQTGVTSYSGKIYGTTAAGGSGPCKYYPSNGCGTIFTSDPSGSNYKMLYELPVSAGTSGEYPSALVPDAGGTLYGTTMLGGRIGQTFCSYGCGTIFDFDPKTKTFTTLHKFQGPLSQDGETPEDTTFQAGSALVLGSGEIFYGTTYYGGIGCPGDSCGTAFEIGAGSSPNGHRRLVRIGR